MLKLPPFGKPLYHLIKENKFPQNDVYIFIGENAWDKAQAFQRIRSYTLCLPPDKSPHNYYWPVKNCDVLLFDSGGLHKYYIDNLVTCLFKDEANIVRYVSPENLLTVFKKDF